MGAGAHERPSGQLLRYIGIFEQTTLSQAVIGASVSVDIQLACHRYHLWLSRPNVFFQSTFSERATNAVCGCLAECLVKQRRFGRHSASLPPISSVADKTEYLLKHALRREIRNLG